MEKIPDVHPLRHLYFFTDPLPHFLFFADTPRNILFFLVPPGTFSQSSFLHPRKTLAFLPSRSIFSNSPGTFSCTFVQSTRPPYVLFFFLFFFFLRTTTTHFHFWFPFPPKDQKWNSPKASSYLSSKWQFQLFFL